MTDVNTPWFIMNSLTPSQVNPLWMRMMVVEVKMMMFTPSAALENMRNTAALCSPIRNSNFTKSDQMADKPRDIPMEDWITNIKSINIHWVELMLGLILLLKLLLLRLIVGKNCG